MQLSIEQIVAATGGGLAFPPRDRSEEISQFTWDSREVKPGFLFVALVGEQVDGHSFVKQALLNGAHCVLISRPLDEDTLALAQQMGAAVVQVQDCAWAIQALARTWRTQLRARVVALTGSVGKTTTKNMVREVLSTRFQVTATSGNQNNELGLPKTLLSAKKDDDAVVLEMGMRGKGQIAQLCEIAQPDWGIIVNVGTSHLELLGTRENIALAKGELLEALPQGGWAFLYSSDNFATFLRHQARLDERGVKVALFDDEYRDEYSWERDAFAETGPDVFSQSQDVGLGGSLDRAPSSSKGESSGFGEDANEKQSKLLSAKDSCVWAQDISLDEQGCPHFTLCARGFSLQDLPFEQVPCWLTLPGKHNVANACAACAVGLAFGLSLEEITSALSGVQAEEGRARVCKAKAGFTVVDDAYNANPDSMCAALEAFAARQVEGRRIAVLGDMGELGSYTQEGHWRVGKKAAHSLLSILVCVGEFSSEIAQAAKEEGFSLECIYQVEDAQAALDLVRTLVCPDDALLIKASHSVGLSQVVEGLVN